VALDTEMARRTNGVAPGQAQNDQPVGSTKAPMPDATWADFSAVAMEKWATETEQALTEHNLVDLAQVPAANRWTIFNRINALVGTQS